MTVLAGLHYTFNFNFYEIDLQEAGNYLSRATAQYADLIFRQHTKIDIDFNEGSLRTNILIVGLLALNNYGDLRSTIDYIIKDTKLLQQLVTGELVKNGLNEELILTQKRIHCAPDRIRKVLLAIERFEANDKLSQVERSRQLSAIKKSINNICSELSDQDAQLFTSSISNDYRPLPPGIPRWSEPYRFSAREEDLTPPSFSFPPKIKAQQPELLTEQWNMDGPPWF